jgi:hypothetical protein
MCIIFYDTVFFNLIENLIIHKISTDNNKRCNKFNHSYDGYCINILPIKLYVNAFFSSINLVSICITDPILGNSINVYTYDII